MQEYYKEPWEYINDKDREEEELIKLYPVCSNCGEHVGDYHYVIDREIYCEECISDFKVETEPLEPYNEEEDKR